MEMKSSRRRLLHFGIEKEQSMASYPKSSSYEGRFSRPWKSSDLVLEVEGRKFHVHRAVLIVCSPVFETMLSSNFKEKSAKEIPLPDKKADEIEQLLQGIYPDKDLWITKENCFSLLKLSTEYQIDRLKARSEEYVSYWCNDGMTVDEAIQVIIFGQKYPLSERTVQGCVRRFVSQTNQAWVEMKQHKLYPELEPAYVQRITEERMSYLEERSYIGSSVYKNEQSRKREHEEDLLRAEKGSLKEKCFRV